MPRIAYVDKNFRAPALAIIDQADGICRSYAAQGFNLTLRQLYYQFVARGLIANKQTEYDRLGAIINDARLAGVLDWDYIVDITRELDEIATWDSPGDIIESAASSYRTDKWKNQDAYVEVWIEKDALKNVFTRVCRELELPLLSCRGYTSQSELWRAANRHIRQGKSTIVLHFGDHDPSGIDMTRDIQDRLTLFGADTEVHRLALNMDQVRQYNPPPNPAKFTDSRSSGYIDQYGYDSWELDALSPQVLSDILRDEVKTIIDQERWDEEAAEEEIDKTRLGVIANQWDDVVTTIREAGLIDD